MRFIVTAKPRSKTTKITKKDNGHYVVAVSEPPTQGKANAAIIRALSQYFGVSPSRISIKMGKSSREKLIEIHG